MSHVCICIYVYMYMYIYIYIYMHYTYRYICISTYTCVVQALKHPVSENFWCRCLLSAFGTRQAKCVACSVRPISLLTLSLLRLLDSDFFPMGLGIPPLTIKIMLQSNPLNSIMLVPRLAVNTTCLATCDCACALCFLAMTCTSMTVATEA